MTKMYSGNTRWLVKRAEYITYEQQELLIPIIICKFVSLHCLQRLPMHHGLDTSDKSMSLYSLSWPHHILVKKSIISIFFKECFKLRNTQVLLLSKCGYLILEKKIVRGNFPIIDSECILDLLWPYSSRIGITRENCVQTTLRLRPLARGPVWIRHSFLKCSSLKERGRERERKKTHGKMGQRGKHGAECCG